VAGKKRRKIRKSQEIVLGVAMLSLVATVTGCDDPSQRRRCVDSTGKVVAEDQCREAETRYYYGGGPPMFFWYFGGWGGYGPGSFVSGGTYVSPRGYSGGGRFSGSPGVGSSGGNVSSGSGSVGGSVSRGGFGGSASAHGGGGGIGG